VTARGTRYGAAAGVKPDSVLVPLAAELGISLGSHSTTNRIFAWSASTTGRRFNSGGRAAFDYMLSLVRELQDTDFRPEAVFLAVLLVFADAVSVIRWLCHGASKLLIKRRP
jgi:hypothetical protein